LTVRPGEIHAVVGANGAGKSTLVRILAGAEAPDTGRTTVAGQTLDGSPGQALRLGVRTIFQQPHLVPTLTLGENVALGELPRVRLGRFSRRELARDTEPWLRAVGLGGRGGEPAAGLGPAEQQLLEIAKALHRSARYLILDEPTATSLRDAAEHLFALLVQLRERGTGILLISHHLHDVLALADRITVLRDGRVVARPRIGQTDRGSLLAAMIGEQPARVTRRRRERVDAEQPALRLSGVSSGRAAGVDLELRRGEIVGLTGVLGSGTADVVRCLFGLAELTAGSLQVGHRQLRPRHPAELTRVGVALVPEDLKAHAVVSSMDIADNLSLAHFAARPGLWRRARSERRAASEIMRMLDIRASGPRTPVSSLSGGNQRKVAFGRSIRNGAVVLVLHEPTAGIDEHAKLQLRDRIDAEAATGTAILIVSSDVRYLTTVVDRVAVMRRGQITAQYDGDECEERAIVDAAVAGRDE
jgi:ABC-type sugar transport system ATPase subunit